ncbi:MAG: tRNA-dihydrouridine synthase family protein [Muribaculaceae bacterium]|nr:tRNA-dihydrouridine synthase family protein [Muribaculaceae bacterium]
MIAAPVQGHTDAAWRHFHAEVFGPLNDYTTPFIRLEHGEIRRRDLNDAFSPLNNNHKAIPQVIFKNLEELSQLVGFLSEKDAHAIDINMGCPFPLQTARGRGAATLSRPEALEAVRTVVSKNPEIDFSVKLRLGMSDSEEWRKALPVLNGLKLSRIVLHPRIAKEQYGGEPRLGSFAEFLRESENPVVYNGDIRSIEDYNRIMEQFPEVSDVMLGRGLLGRPSLAAEIAEGKVWSRERRIELMIDFHRRLFTYYMENLQGGDHQVLSKICPFWEYAQDEIGRKAWKAIKKTANMAKYHSALAIISSI